MRSGVRGGILEIPPFVTWIQPTIVIRRGTMSGGQFDWGGRPKE